MRLRASLAVVCAAALSLALAGPVVAGARHTSGSGPVRIVLGGRTFRAGQTVSVTVINSGGSLILRGLCFTLARDVGARRVTITRTHGIPVPCPPTAGIPQPARTREPLGLPLYDDLAAGHYTITLRYKSVTPHGRDLGRLAGPTVRSLSAQLTVLAFRPGAEPQLSEKTILTLARRAAANAGDRTPTLIQHVESTRFEAVRISSDDLVFEWNWSYLIAVRGHFVANDVSIPPGAKAPTGSVMTLVVDAATGQGTDFGLSKRYPPLAELGRVTTDFRAPAAYSNVGSDSKPVSGYIPGRSSPSPG
jgi:hypothetical protein